MNRSAPGPATRPTASLAASGIAGTASRSRTGQARRPGRMPGRCPCRYPGLRPGQRRGTAEGQSGCSA